MSITRKIVEGKSRTGILPRYIGNQFMHFERMIYGYAEHFVEGYQGGFWSFYSLSNEGFYMSLDSDKEFTFTNPDNYFSESMDADTMSIIINLYVYNHLAFKFEHQNSVASARFTKLYLHLNDYASEHPNAATIFRAID